MVNVGDKLTNAPDLPTLGARLRWSRLNRHLSQQQVAAYLGYPRHAMISHWENGRNFPALDAFVQVAGLYGVSADWLIWGDGMSDSIDERVRAIPDVLRDGLLMRLHEEIAKTEEAAARLPAGMRGDTVKDTDTRLHGWSARNLMAKPAKKAKKAASPRDH